MNKKIISAVLAVLMMSSTAAIAASAAEVEAEASKDSGKIQFDLGDWNHDDKIAFYIWDSSVTPAEFCSKDGWSTDNQWGSKKLQGEELGDGVVESYEIDFSGREGHNIFVIFHDRTTDAQTYDCVLNTEAIGHKAYMTGVTLENPEDSEKVAIEAVFEGIDPSVCGPYKKVTSTGNIVGNCAGPDDQPAKIVAEYIYKKMGAVDKSGVECVTEAKVDDALNQFGTNADDVWAEFQNYFDSATESEHNSSKDEEAKKLLKISSGDANTDTAADTDSATDTEKSSDTNNTTGNSGSTGTTKTTTTTTKSSTGTTTTTTTTASNTNATASAEAGAATGDTTGTAAFGVVLAAAAATMFLARKKVED